MPIVRLIDPLLDAATPLTSPFLAVLVVGLLAALSRRVKRPAALLGILLAATAAFWIAYRALSVDPRVERWLASLNTPLVTVLLLIVLPAVYLPRGRARRVFLVLPAATLVVSVLAVFDAYRTVPPGKSGFYWFLIRPAYFMGGVASLLVLLQSLLSLSNFRRVVRATCLLVLLYGGFAFRQNYADYQGMLERRREAQPNMMLLSETSPVLLHDRRMLHLPSAPCRFTADGGYVQGCNLELLQRIMQSDLTLVARRDPAAVSGLSVAMGAMVLLLGLCLLSGRWTCGWLCPLSTLGGILDWLRKLVGLPHLKPSQPVKLTYLFSGLSLAGVALAMAKAAPHVDEQGKFAGCKIPIYPFCKICPSQQVCPVAAHGLSNYSGLPTWEWGFGFFRVASVTLLAVFLGSFLVGRRLWCRLCPMGMIAGLFNRGGFFTLRKDAAKCNQCGVCADVCPADIDLVRREMERPDVSSFDCVLCLKCVEKCPRDECLTLDYAGLPVVRSRFKVETR
ncbi:MAG: 4Fe-4S dicluster domain-containing protein [Planctomycetota bacterium]